MNLFDKAVLELGVAVVEVLDSEDRGTSNDTISSDSSLVDIKAMFRLRVALRKLKEIK